MPLALCPDGKGSNRRGRESGGMHWEPMDVILGLPKAERKRLFWFSKAPGEKNDGVAVVFASL